MKKFECVIGIGDYLEVDNQVDVAVNAIGFKIFEAETNKEIIVALHVEDCLELANLIKKTISKENK